MTISITLIGGPTARIEIDGFRLLTDPTFDAPGAYQLPHVKLEKLTGPALSADAVGEVDAVLLSHDQHSDNLDHSGKDFLEGNARADHRSRRQAARRPRRRLCATGEY
jgi:L-ascorbate metabolism protein UlaG (beta-lactamase superfamily)